MSSRGNTKLKSTECDMITRENKTSNEGVTHAKIGNLQEDFKRYILGTLKTQFDIMQAKQKQAEAEKNLAVFFPRCRKKHNHKEGPLDVIKVCAICKKYHPTE